MKLNDYSLWTALVTPLTPGLEIDFKSLENILKEQDDAGNGILLLGSTGEALNLDIEAKKSIVTFAQTLNLKSPLMVGVGGHQLKSQLNWTKWLETQKIDAYLMVTPIYSKPGTEGQYQWFKTLMDSVSRPVMLYNVPGRAAKELCLTATKRLATHKNFWAIKEASGSVQKFKQYLDVSLNGNVYCGDDGLMFSFANAGSKGLVSVASNTWPKETNLYVKKCLDQSLSEIELWENASNSLFIASNPVPAKALLASENRISHGTMMPPLAEEDLKDTAKLKLYSEQIKTWFKKES